MRFAPGTSGREQFVDARFYSQAAGSNERLAEVLRQELASLDPRLNAPKPEKSIKEAFNAEVSKRSSARMRRKPLTRPDRRQGYGRKDG